MVLSFNESALRVFLFAYIYMYPLNLELLEKGYIDINNKIMYFFLFDDKYYYIDTINKKFKFILEFINLKCYIRNREYRLLGVYL